MIYIRIVSFTIAVIASLQVLKVFESNFDFAAFAVGWFTVRSIMDLINEA